MWAARRCVCTPELVSGKSTPGYENAVRAEVKVIDNGGGDYVGEGGARIGDDTTAETVIYHRLWESILACLGMHSKEKTKSEDVANAVSRLEGDIQVQVSLHDCDARNCVSRTVPTFSLTLSQLSLSHRPNFLKLSCFAGANHECCEPAAGRTTYVGSAAGASSPSRQTQWYAPSRHLHEARLRLRPETAQQGAPRGD